MNEDQLRQLDRDWRAIAFMLLLNPLRLWRLRREEMVATLHLHLAQTQDFIRYLEEDDDVETGT